MNDERILSRLSDQDNSLGQDFFGRDAIVIFARAPVPGMVKSRLSQSIGAEKAARIYAAMLRDCLALAQNAALVGTKVLLSYTPADGFEIGRHSLSPLWNGARYLQPEGDLGARLLDCFSCLKNCGAQKIVIIGSDAPDIPIEFITAALAALNAHDLVFGPTADGGFYLLGAREISPALFKNVAWSSASTLATILANATREKQDFTLLDSWRDVDEMEDLQALISRLESGQSSAQYTSGQLRSENFFER